MVLVRTMLHLSLSRYYDFFGVRSMQQIIKHNKTKISSQANPRITPSENPTTKRTPVTICTRELFHRTSQKNQTF